MWIRRCWLNFIMTWKYLTCLNNCFILMIRMGSGWLLVYIAISIISSRNIHRNLLCLSINSEIIRKCFPCIPLSLGRRRRITPFRKFTYNLPSIVSRNKPHSRLSWGRSRNWRSCWRERSRCTSFRRSTSTPCSASRASSTTCFPSTTSTPRYSRDSPLFCSDTARPNHSA